MTPQKAVDSWRHKKLILPESEAHKNNTVSSIETEQTWANTLSTITIREKLETRHLFDSIHLVSFIIYFISNYVHMFSI